MAPSTDDVDAALVQVGDHRIAGRGFVSDRSVELDGVDQRGEPRSIDVMPGQERQADCARLSAGFAV